MVLEIEVQLESEPPERVISDSTKSDETSERVKVTDAVSPALRVVISDVKAMVGAVVSMTMA